MERFLNRNLLYEVVRYEPTVLLMLECCSETINHTASGDAAYIQTLIEDLYYRFDTRDLSFPECKNFLKPVVDLIIQPSNTKDVILFDVTNGNVVKYTMD